MGGCTYESFSPIYIDDADELPVREPSADFASVVKRTQWRALGADPPAFGSNCMFGFTVYYQPAEPAVTAIMEGAASIINVHSLSNITLNATSGNETALIDALLQNPSTEGCKLGVVFDKVRSGRPRSYLYNRLLCGIMPRLAAPPHLLTPRSSLYNRLLCGIMPRLAAPHLLCLIPHTLIPPHTICSSPAHSFLNIC